MKINIRKIIAVIFSVAVLATCSNPTIPNENEGERNFVINIGSRGNARSTANYPPKINGDGAVGAPDITELDFTVTFAPIPSGTATKFTAKGSQNINGKIAQGDYVVTMDVKWNSELYAQGCAVDNPVKIVEGLNNITVWVYSYEDSSAMPVIKSKLNDADYKGYTPTAMTVDVAPVSGTLSYQWYSNTTKSNSGGTEIDGKTTASFTPDTSKPGNFYYYCEVTNTDGAKSTTKAVTNAARVMVADMVWTLVDNSTLGNSATFLEFIDYCGGMFFAFTRDYNGDHIAYSTDGKTWTIVDENTPYASMVIAYGNGKFVGVMWNTSGSGYVACSTDGKEWTGKYDNDMEGMYAIAYGNGKFVAGGTKNYSNSKMAYSADGVTWTAVEDSTFGTSTINKIAYGNGKFVAVGDSGKMAYSADGVTWTAVGDSTFDTSTINKIAYGNGKFVAVGVSGKMAWSADGVTWTSVTNSTFSTTVSGIAYGNSKFVAVGSSGTPPPMATWKTAYSADGVTWTAIDITSKNLTVAYGGGRFILNSSNGIAYCMDD